MGFFDLFILAFGLAMDAFAVSICKGLSMKKATLREGAICGAWFGAFQALMPLIGFFLCKLFEDAIRSFDHWVAFILLGLIGANMLKEALEHKCCDCDQKNGDLSFKTMLIMAIATSIDALAVGISPLGTEPGTNIFLAVTLIGVITCGLCVAGVKIGNLFGSRYEKGARLAGGIILILLGTKILVEHLMEHGAAI